ncbi:MAG TPA: Xaa-Pro peptidase family protein [Acidimicrobiales bacterium]|nr:Xaa-Pro peptidase family protein [Acidimicrobiales bacterium]
MTTTTRAVTEAPIWSSSPFGELDLARMRRQRGEKLRAEMAKQGVPALLLLGGGSVQYAVGAETLGVDSARAGHRRTAALVVAGDDEPHLFTPYPEGAPPELSADHVHDALVLESDGGVGLLAGVLGELAGGEPERLALDDMSGAMHRLLPGLLPKTELVDCGRIMVPAKVLKTDDELECIHRAHRINELAMYDVQQYLRPGLRQSDLSALFLRRIYELGCTSNGIDPIWQVIPSTKEGFPWTTSGELAFPLTTTDRILAEGDVIWCDTGIHYQGYASDFGRTWIVSRDPKPTAAQREAFRRWRDVVAATLAVTRPGATGAQLAAAAKAADKGHRTPWLSHFYLIHGLGTESAEAPMIGTDMGEEHDEALVLAPGMVLVLEPVIWDEGVGGYRAEDIVGVTEDGWVALSDYPYDPYES